MAAKRDYYETLGVARDADAGEIKTAFRKLAFEFHPDRNKDPKAEERFKEIAEAYAVLSDTEKRAAYDSRGHAGMAGVSPEDLFGGIDFEDILRGQGLDHDFGFADSFGVGGGLFDRFFGRRRRSGPQQGRHRHVELAVPLEDLLTGREETVRVNYPQTCESCRGTGAKVGTSPRACETCQGSGRKVETRQEGNATFQQITTCPECRGQGQFVDTPCADCAGRGQVPKHEELSVVVPKGAEDWLKLRIPGRGLPSPDPGGPAGDLFVVVHSLPDSRFERHGADLWHEEQISVPDAVLGAKLDVATLEGTAEVCVPPGTQPNAVLRLQGQGLPRFGRDDERGDLYVRMRVRVAEQPSPEARRLYEQLRDLTSLDPNAPRLEAAPEEGASGPS